MNRRTTDTRNTSCNVCAVATRWALLFLALLLIGAAIDHAVALHGCAP